MRRLIITPKSWACALAECEPGFFVYEDQLCFKSEYGPDDVYNSAGERFSDKTVIVQPVEAEWEDV